MTAGPPRRAPRLHKGIGVSHARTPASPSGGFRFGSIGWEGLAVVSRSVARRQDARRCRTARQDQLRGTPPSNARGVYPALPRGNIMKKSGTVVDVNLLPRALAGLRQRAGSNGLAGTGRRGAARPSTINARSLFLDFRCRRMNGFEVIDAVGSDKIPRVIFVTAYDHPRCARSGEVRATIF